MLFREVHAYCLQKSHVSACNYGGSAVMPFVSYYGSIKILVALSIWTKRMGTNEQLVVFVYMMALISLISI